MKLMSMMKKINKYRLSNKSYLDLVATARTKYDKGI